MSDPKDIRWSAADTEPPPLPAEPPPTEDRRKSLGLLKDITTSWTAEPPTRKYSLNDNINQYNIKSATIPDLSKIDPSNPVSTDFDESFTTVSLPEPSGSEDVTVPPKSKSETDFTSAAPESPIKEIVHFIHKDPKPNEKRIDKVKKDAESSAGTSSMPPTPRTAMKMSCMEEEAIRDRLRAVLLRQIAQILESEGTGIKYTRDSFRRAFLNKVGQCYITSGYLKGNRPRLLRMCQLVSDSVLINSA